MKEQKSISCMIDYCVFMSHSNYFFCNTVGSNVREKEAFLVSLNQISSSLMDHNMEMTT